MESWEPRSSARPGGGDSEVPLGLPTPRFVNKAALGLSPLDLGAFTRQPAALRFSGRTEAGRRSGPTASRCRTRCGPHPGVARGSRDCAPGGMGGRRGWCASASPGGGPGPDCAPLARAFVPRVAAALSTCTRALRVPLAGALVPFPTRLPGHRR